MTAHAMSTRAIEAPAIDAQPMRLQHKQETPRSSDKSPSDNDDPHIASGIPGVTFRTSFDLCLRPFLEAIGWEGEGRHLVEAIPHMDSIHDLDTFRSVVSRLGIKTDVHRLAPRDLTAEQLPAIVLASGQNPVLLLTIEGGGNAIIFDPEAFEIRNERLTNRLSYVCIRSRQSVSNALKTQNENWFLSALHGFRRPIFAIFLLTFAANVLSMATPLYVMNVYNLVIGAKSFGTLPFMLAGVITVLALEIYLKAARGRVLAFVGARMSAGLMNSGLSRLLGLPINMIEAAPMGAQILRLKQLENTHAFFTGPVSVALLDLPFILLFFAAISVLSPALAVVPVVLVAIFAVLAVVAIPGTRKRNTEMNNSVSESQNFLTDAISKKFSINQLRNEADWHRRFIPIARETSLKRFRVQFFDAMLGTVSQSLVMLSGVSTLLIGAVLVMRGDLSVGALIAIMMLIWRILAPIQTVFTNLNRISQFLESVKQINLLMRIPVERETGTEAPVARKFRGRVTFSGVAFRYGAQDEPVFRGLNLDIPEGQFVCISSATAGGKSTILKLILGLYKPQAGGIFLDGLNLQQLDPHEVRASIGYLPLEPTFFYGTIAQNLRLAAPTATDAEIHQALQDAGVDITAPMFPEGIETRLSSERLAQIPPGTQQSLSMARMYCKRSPIFLLNDPDARLDDTGSQALIAKLSKLKGKSTIILISNKREHLSMCDRILKLSNGVIVEDSPPVERQHD